MTLDEARDHIGCKVIYRAHPAASCEEGVITSVNDVYVFVRYGSDAGSKATMPSCIEPSRIETGGLSG